MPKPTHALALLTFLALSARANPYLEKAKAEVQRLRYAQAIPLLEAARRVPGNAAAQDVEVLELLGMCLIAEGKRAQAEFAFGQLLELHPHHQLNSELSPKIVDAYLAAKARLYPPDFARLERQPSSTRFPTVRLVDPWRRVQAVVLFSRAAADKWSETQGKPQGDLYSFEGPTDAEAFFIEARDGQRKALASLGSLQNPERLRALAKASEPHAPTTIDTGQGRRRAGWILVGTSLACAGAGAYFNARAADTAQKMRQERWVDTARALRQQAQTEAVVGAALLVGSGATAISAGVLFVW